MKKSLLVLVLFLASCASISNYPLTLSYRPSKHFEKADGKTITVAQLSDRRAIDDKRAIGMKDDEAKFISLIYTPSEAIARSFATYLADRGYKVKTLDQEWDGDARSIKPDWGDMVIGGVLEDFKITSRNLSLVKTEYVCSVKYSLVFADPKTKEIKHKERFDVSTSYVTVNFSRDKAEELINKALAEAVERSLANVNDYFTKQ